MLTYRIIVILFSADTTWEINLIRNRQWFNELDLGKVLCVWGSFKRFSLRWEVKKRKKVLRPGVTMSKCNWEGVGNSWSYRLSNIIACTEDVNKTADLNALQERDNEKLQERVKSLSGEYGWMLFQIHEQRPTKISFGHAQRSRAAVVAGGCSKWEVQPEAVSPAAAPKYCRSCSALCQTAPM